MTITEPLKANSPAPAKPAATIVSNVCVPSALTSILSALTLEPPKLASTVLVTELTITVPPTPAVPPAASIPAPVSSKVTLSDA